MAGYTYEDIIMNPEDPRLEGAIGKVCYFGDYPIGVLDNARNDLPESLFRLKSIDKKSVYPFLPDGYEAEWALIIIKKEEPKPKYVPFESKEEFIEAFHYHDNDKYSETDDILLNYGMWLKSMCLGNFYQVTIIKKSGIFTDDNSSIITWEQLLEKYTFLDGTPCGKESKDV